jgi:hypothetical protein
MFFLGWGAWLAAIWLPYHWQLFLTGFVIFLLRPDKKKREKGTTTYKQEVNFTNEK